MYAVPGAFLPFFTFLLLRSSHNTMNLSSYSGLDSDFQITSFNSEVNHKVHLVGPSTFCSHSCVNELELKMSEHMHDP